MPPDAPPPPPDAARRRFRRLAWTAAALVYVAIVIGGIVRVSGSGLGCGDNWPLCNGHLVPPLSFATLVEYSHRLKALVVTVAVLAVAAHAWRHRQRPAFAGLVAPSLLAVALLAAQIALGALTVVLELPWWTTSLHLVTSMLLLGSLLAAAVRARDTAATGDAVTHADGFTHYARATAAAALATVALGAAVANTGLPPASPQPSAAAFACLGFPLCNGRLLPGPGLLVGLHWTHRALAYLLAALVVGLVALSHRWRRGAPLAWAHVAGCLVAAQVAVAAYMVVAHVPDVPRVLHMALGAAVWGALVVTAMLARRGALTPTTGAR
ncbi:MAG TPA: COX15/CtaA family protein [Gemmatimonadaceae bacterium]|nr:COX15/CtaA family protein [Gemmatimonadaceae bacterium]